MLFSVLAADRDRRYEVFLLETEVDVWVLLAPDDDRRPGPDQLPEGDRRSD
jgi:hypothetical protein